MALTITIEENGRQIAKIENDVLTGSMEIIPRAMGSISRAITKDKAAFDKAIANIAPGGT